MSGAEIFLEFLLFPGLLFTVAAGLLTSWVDRKVTAMVQMRVGPPLLQPFYDIRKYFIKETCVPQGGAIMVFAGEPGLAANVREWIAKLDQPATEAGERIFGKQPRAGIERQHAPREDAGLEVDVGGDVDASGAGPVEGLDQPVGLAVQAAQGELDVGNLDRQVGHDAPTPAQFRGRTPHVGVGLRMHRVLAVGHVQARHVHALFRQLFHLVK